MLKSIDIRKKCWYNYKKSAIYAEKLFYLNTSEKNYFQKEKPAGKIPAGWEKRKIMLKPQLEEELKKANKAMEEQKKAFIALAEVKKRTDKEEIRQFLTDFFKWEENSIIIGFDPDEVNYYLWLSEEPERKKA